MNTHIEEVHFRLVNHEMYHHLESLEAIRILMEHHVFAVWDFMSLLKSLQRRVTCIGLPWRPSDYSPEMVRLVNQLVLDEESDVDQNGEPRGHFELYLDAMEEVGANTMPIRAFIECPNPEMLPSSVRPFVTYHMKLALHGTVEEIAAAFFYGRERILPELFEQILISLHEERLNCPTLRYYLERHIDVDLDQHGPMIAQFLQNLLHGDPRREEKANRAAIESLQWRQFLWDQVVLSIRARRAPQIRHHEKVMLA